MLHHQFIDDLANIDPTLWDTLFNSDPLVSHAFLLACQQSGAANELSGWLAQHLVIYQDNVIVAILPGYLKTHSYGEYVFDWSWAEAYQQHGLTYYPKWVCGVPFSPVTGTRIGCQQLDESLIQYISNTLHHQCEQHAWSGWHINFLPQDQSTQLSHYMTMQRIGVQFQWFNQGYTDFDHFLDRFTARRRKTLKKERQKALADNISVSWLEGDDITTEVMDQFTVFYQQTYLKRSGHLGYFNQVFFRQLQLTLRDKLVIMVAKKEQEIIAATLSFKSHDTLFGRYWGAKEHYDFLHFELCYYQGIEYCIKHGLACFHAGAQGEHKIMRGFAAVLTYSNHAIVHPEFKTAISHFIDRETTHLHHYQQQCLTLLPFKKDAPI